MKVTIIRGRKDFRARNTEQMNEFENKAKKLMQKER